CHGSALACRGLGSALGAVPKGTLEVGGYLLAAKSATVSQTGGAVSGLVFSGRVLASRGGGCPKGTPMQLTLAANALVLEVFCGPAASHIYTTSDIDARLAYAG